MDILGVFSREKKHDREEVLIKLIKIKKAA
jgi:hypothetical protein